MVFHTVLYVGCSAQYWTMHNLGHPLTVLDYAQCRAPLVDMEQQQSSALVVPTPPTPLAVSTTHRCSLILCTLPRYNLDWCLQT